MPVWLQRIEFIISCLGLFVSIYTLCITWSIRKKVLLLRQIENFHLAREQHINRLIGFVNSIQKDHLTSATMRSDIRIFLRDLQTGCEFFSRKTKKQLKLAIAEVDNESPNWDRLIDYLITIKNYLPGEG